jgi:pimeloyl-ACP methyl ester carboxylesterase
VDESGDACLTTFASVVDAVKCGMAVQAVLASDPALQVRIGIHVGDVVAREGRLIGDGINVASRLPALAAPGGICASDRVVEHLRNQNIATTSMGERSLKNVARPVPVYAISGAPPRRGVAGGRPSRRALALAAGLLVALLALYLLRAGGLEDLMMVAIRGGLLRPGATYEQEIAFTTTSDGVRIAYSTTGEGPPVVLILGWFTHLEQGANSPGLNLWAPALLPRHRIVQYDGRGSGLSDRGISDFSLEAKLRDLEAVIAATGLERFALYAVSAGGPTAIAYAVRNPERVTRIAFYGSFASFAAAGRRNLERWKSFPQLVRTSWGEDNPAFRQLFTSLFMPESDALSIRMFNEFQRMAATPEDAAAFIESLIDTDVTPLAPRIRVPTLVVHVRGDQVVPFALGREVAALVPGSRLVGIEGPNHMIMSDDAAYQQFEQAIAGFFAADVEDSPAAPPRG